MKLNLKKITVVLLALALAVPVTACGKKEDNKGNNDKTSTEASAAQTGEMPKTFPEFTGTDLDGNKVDGSVFKEPVSYTHLRAHETN